MFSLFAGTFPLELVVIVIVVIIIIIIIIIIGHVCLWPSMQLIMC
jgi:hypothetical protein